MTGNRGIYRFTAARLVPAYGYPAPLVFNKSVPAADDVDGQPLAGKHLGPVEQVAVDNQGRLLFSEESGDCVQIRELQADGTVTTLAGRRCPDPMTGSDYREARFPLASTKPDQLYLSTTADEFAVTGDDELSIGTDRSILRVDTQRKLVSIVSALTDDALSVPAAPLGSRPGSKTVPINSLAVAPYFGFSTIAASASGALAIMDEQRQLAFPTSYGWRTTQPNEQSVPPNFRVWNGSLAFGVGRSRFSGVQVWSVAIAPGW